MVALLRAGTEPSAPVTGLDWTVGQLGAHVASTSDRYSRMAEGEAVVNTSVSERRTADRRRHRRAPSRDCRRAGGRGRQQGSRALSPRCAAAPTTNASPTTASRSLRRSSLGSTSTSSSSMGSTSPGRTTARSTCQTARRTARCLASSHAYVVRAHPVGSHLLHGARLGCTRPSAHRRRARQAARSGSPTTATDASTPGSVVRPRTSSWRATDDSALSPRSGRCACAAGAPTAASSRPARSSPPDTADVTGRVGSAGAQPGNSAGEPSGSSAEMPMTTFIGIGWVTSYRYPNVENTPSSTRASSVVTS